MKEKLRLFCMIRAAHDLKQMQLCGWSSVMIYLSQIICFSLDGAVLRGGPLSVYLVSLSAIAKRSLMMSSGKRSTCQLTNWQSRSFFASSSFLVSCHLDRFCITFGKAGILFQPPIFASLQCQPLVLEIMCPQKVFSTMK